MRPILAVAIALCTTAVVAACGDDEDESASETASAEPSVSFVEPAEGSSSADTVTAEVELENFDLNAEAVGMGAQDGEGHLHFSLDGGKFDTAKYSGPNGELAEELGVDGQYSPSTEPTITYEGLPPGKHTLEVALANNDHTDTGATATTTFTVE